MTETSMLSAFTPTGRLRAAINLGNPILARVEPATGAPRGVSVDLAREFARRIGADIELIAFATAGQSVDAVTREEADIGFFAVDPARAAGIAFTTPYVLIEGSYLVAETSTIQNNEAVDRPGIRVAVGKDSAYDLFLTRELKHAEIVRAPSSPAVVETFVAQGLDVAAGVRQQLEAELPRFPGHLMLPGCFMVIRQAMGAPRGRGDAAHQFLNDFVEEMKANGFVADALKRHGIAGVSLAPAAGSAA